ncbi:MAG: ATP synthase F1 subunit delta [Bacteroidia bacterium]|nr:ATP synthase F1 subunit delta [Bacteroidia bacterium]
MTSRAASRYALAILDARPDDVSLETLLRDLQDVRASVHASRELEMFFLSPIISRQHKHDAVKGLFEGRISAYTLGALLLLVEKSREDLLVEIIEAVFTLHREREGIIRSRITSAVDLPEEQRVRIAEALQKVSGKKVETEYVTDPDIMAGLVVRLGDTVYDGSVRRQLQRLRARFISGS